MHRAALVALLAALALGAAACGSSPNPADTRIVFVTSRDGDYAIYGMKADGSGQRRLTKSKPTRGAAPQDVFFQVDPAWSPDGTKIVFASTREGRSHIYVMKSDGSGTTQLTSGKLDDSNPTWSPDGRTIVFERDNELYATPSTGGKAHRLTNPLDGGKRDPAFSPDGRWIAYVERQPGFDSHEIWRMRADGHDLRRVTKLNASSYTPAWSRDGRRIVFSSNVHDGRYQLYQIGANGQGLTRLSFEPSDYFDPSWSPDGRTLLFERDGRVYIRKVGGVETAITDGPNDGSPAWRPVVPQTSG